MIDQDRGAFLEPRTETNNGSWWSAWPRWAGKIMKASIRLTERARISATGITFSTDPMSLSRKEDVHSIQAADSRGQHRHRSSASPEPVPFRRVSGLPDRSDGGGSSSRLRQFVAAARGPVSGGSDRGRHSGGASRREPALGHSPIGQVSAGQGGEVVLPFVWPATAPAATSLSVQSWVADGGGGVRRIGEQCAVWSVVVGEADCLASATD